MVLDIIIRRYWASKSKPKEGYNEIADLLKPIRDSQQTAKEAEGLNQTPQKVNEEWI